MAHNRMTREMISVCNRGQNELLWAGGIPESLRLKAAFHRSRARPVCLLARQGYARKPHFSRALPVRAFERKRHCIAGTRRAFSISELFSGLSSSTPQFILGLPFRSLP